MHKRVPPIQDALCIGYKAETLHERLPEAIKVIRDRGGRTNEEEAIIAFVELAEQKQAAGHSIEVYVW